MDRMSRYFFDSICVSRTVPWSGMVHSGAEAESDR